MRYEEDCYYCGSTGHLSDECALRAFPDKPEMTDDVPTQDEAFPPMITCRYCDEHGHYSQDCPTRAFPEKPEITNICTCSNKWVMNDDCPYHSEKPESKCGCSFCYNGWPQHCKKIKSQKHLITEEFDKTRNEIICELDKIHVGLKQGIEILKILDSFGSKLELTLAHLEN